MFTPAIRRYFCAAILMAGLIGPEIFGQEKSRDPGLLQKQSLAHFEKDDYGSALAGYKMLLQEDPDNAMYAYYAGICMVELNKNVDDAIELLYGASRRAVPGDVNYYLGKAYHQDYNFSEALKYYQRFQAGASRQEARDYNIKHLISTIRSAKEITSSYNPYEVLNVTFIDLLDSALFSQIRMKGGQLQRKPNEYFAPGEDRFDLNSLMFMPKTVQRGSYIYYTGYSKGKKNGAQLMRVKRGTARAWSDPEEIKDLNSEGDEIMPYFDPIENDLYFASNGRSGIGGFDLYRSHWDSERDSWSPPINLGFPINSAMDEYLLLPGSDLGMVMFFSTRQGTDSTITVYRVHLIEPKKKTVANDNRMLKEIAYLGGVAEDILAEMETLAEAGSDLEVGSDPEPDQMQASAQVPADKEITSVKILDGKKEVNPYQLALADALKHQSTSDSLKDLATAARIRVRESEDPNDRWVWQKQIMVWEKRARDEESRANVLYAQANVSSNTGSTSGPAVNIPETIQVDTVLDALTVYRYTAPMKETKAEAGAGPPVISGPKNAGPVDGEPGTAPAVSKIVPPETNGINRFDILSHSPYSSNNPIPMDVPLPDGAFYRIQMGAFGKAVDPGAFKGISPITGELIPERGLVKYYAGKFSRYDDASGALSRIRSAGYQDAFIVAWYNGSTVSTQKAKQLE
jgi:tetratricopeptide (TPR) repeat protein